MRPEPFLGYVYVAPVGTKSLNKSNIFSYTLPTLFKLLMDKKNTCYFITDQFTDGSSNLWGTINNL